MTELNDDENLNDKMSDAETLQQARDLVNSIETGDMLHASDIIRDLSRIREDSLFFQIGRLTRELHDSLKAFQEDSQICGFAEYELPDARARLTYVIEKTEEAANRTMDNIESTLPISNELAKGAKDLLTEWNKFSRRELSVDEFNELYKQMMAYLEQTQLQAETIHEKLSDVVLAQDFQDLTGQVIRRVITLVTDVESSLVRLVKIASNAQELTGKKVMTHEEAIKGEGPNVGLDKADKVSNQDEVDDLLSSLGF